ncbi:MAG: DUF1847 domain-containing protein [Deltaproteobacteria bacterium]|nr:DUF1847 domain-containing protein [Deltaproteobacteria bacterium]
MDSEICDCAGCSLPRSERCCEKPGGAAPPFCPTENRTGLRNRVFSLLEEPATREFARQAACQEKDGYRCGKGAPVPVKPRLLEIAEFAGRMGYRRLGLAFCSGLALEGKRVREFYAGRGFEMVSVCCKAGQVPKEALGLADRDKLRPGRFEAMCNPFFQALLLNEARTDFNILLGLCVGHDALFFRFAEAPCTVLAVKDRLLGHNPLAAVYQLDSYYRALSDE